VTFDLSNSVTIYISHDLNQQYINIKSNKMQYIAMYYDNLSDIYTHMTYVQ